MHWLQSAFRLVVLSLMLALAFLVSSTGVSAEGNPLVTGPQPLPMGACNEGTANARSNIAPDDPARDWVPHLHTFDGVLGCYHANPTWEPRSS